MTGLALIAAAVLLLAGGLLLAIAAWGVLRLPDALSRQHAATKAGTLALALVCSGAVLAAIEVAEDGVGAWAWRLVLIIGFLLATLPIAAHLLARAAVREGGLDAEADAAPLVGEARDAGPGR